ncbi:hypothetical protein, partial [Deinococcus radiotolerans]|uniref:hypothetical protein n=1 Tax=Deinococcus radiotolerans TaxID=1309407 RepID=UPI001E470C35
DILSSSVDHTELTLHQTLSSSVWGLDETDAVSLALGERRTPNSTMYQWRGVVFPKSDLKALRADLVQVGELPSEI